MFSFLLGLNCLISAQPKLPARPADLVRQLASDQFSQRELATRELEKLGEHALPFLDQAARSPELEISRRAELLRQRIRKQLVRATLLQPAALTWPVGGQNAEQALQAMLRRHDLPVVHGAVRAHLEKTRLAKDIGPAQPWECWQQFLERAEMQEPFLVSRGVRAILQRRQGGAVPLLGKVPDLEDAAPGTMVLDRGGGKIVPTQVAGNLRFRMLAVPGKAPPPNPEGKDIVFLFLETRAWPGAPFLGLEKISLDRITDDRGQDLTWTIGETFAAQAGMVVGSNDQINPWASVQLTPVEVRLRSGITKELEVRGLALVRGGLPEAILTIDRLDQGRDKDLRGAWPGKARLLAADIDEGTLTLRLRLEGVEDLVRSYPGPRAVRLRPGLVAERSAGDILAEHLRLTHRGKTLSWSGVQARDLPNYAGVELEMTCETAGERLAEHRLDLVWPRAHLVEVPFQFKDIRVHR